MRVALLTETWHPYTNGVVTHLSALAAALEENGHQVMVITADPDARRHQVDEKGVLRCPGLAIREVYGYGLALPFSVKRYRLLKQFRPDVIHIHQEFGIGTFGMIASKLLGVPLVYTLHTAYDDYLHYLAPPPLISFVRFLSRSYVKFLASSAVMATGPSEKAAAYLQARRVSTPFQYIPNGVDHHLFSPDGHTAGMRKEMRRRLGAREETLLAVFVGRLGKEKNVDELLYYLNEPTLKNKDIRLLIVGEGPERKSLEQQSMKLGMSERVIFMGKIPHEEMPAFLHGSDVYITASTTEMMSMSMLEARSMGLPVIQREDPWNRDQVMDGVNGFVYRDASSMAKRLLAFYQLAPKEWDEWRQRCVKSVAQQGSGHLASHMLSVYQQALNMYGQQTTEKMA